MFTSYRHTFIEGISYISLEKNKKINIERSVSMGVRPGTSEMESPMLGIFSLLIIKNSIIWLKSLVKSC
jgi:hypothetical protein